jgi:hypothetical protein
MTPDDRSSRGPDLSEEYWQHARQLARRYAVMEGVVGVVLIGELTFGEADRYSDVDLIVYLHQQSLRTWYFGEAPLPEGESRYHGLRLDVSYRDFRVEQERIWTPTECWNVSRAEILYDPEGLVRELLDSKASRSSSGFEDEAIHRATYSRFLLDRTVPAWLYRGDAVSAHHVLNVASDQFIGLLYLMNQQFVPGDDWNVALLAELEWKPDRLEERLFEAMVAKELTTAEASRRRHLLVRLLQDCWNRLASDEQGENRSDALYQARMLRDMVRRGSMSLRDYLERYDAKLLIQSPAFDLVWVDRQQTGTVVRFNYERLETLINHELGRFLNYQQRLLRELAATTGTEIDS